jgi:hypothetical protein
MVMGGRGLPKTGSASSKRLGFLDLPFWVSKVLMSSKLWKLRFKYATPEILDSADEKDTMLMKGDYTSDHSAFLMYFGCNPNFY